MNKIRILVDSTSSITTKQALELGVTVVPTTFIVDGVEHDPTNAPYSLDEFYQKLYEAKVGTACINTYVFEETFKSYLEKNEDVIYVALSSGLSSTYVNAVNASENLKEEFGERVIVIDPLTGGAGMHFVVRAIAKMVNEGKSVTEIKSALDKNSLGVVSYFTIGSLDHLHKGGRLNKVETAIGNTLKAKPIVRANEEGKLKIKAIHLGKRKTIKEMGDLVLENVNEEYPVEISHTNNLDEAEFLRNKLLEANDKLNITFSQIDYTLACHCGPETVAVFYIKK